MPVLPAVTGDAPLPDTPGRRWLARLSFALAFVAVALVLAVAEWKSVAMFAIGLVAAAVSLTTAFLVLSRRGLLRWLALAAFVLTPAAVMAVYAFAGLLWVAAVSAGAWLLAGLTARAALAGDKEYWRMPEFPAAPVRHPFLIMNPRSGGGKVGRLGLRRKAEDLGAEVFLIDGPGVIDVAAVARKAVADGADLLGVAGGDGTQALVAAVAAEHGLPFVVITAGTRNHFALDLGLDRADPVACLNALTDGVELRVDLGLIGGQAFVNNASFGAYAEVVRTPAYREDKLRTTLDTLPDLLQGQRGTRLSAVADEELISAPQALLVASNPYETGDVAGLGRRARLDRGMLGVVALNVGSARQAVGLLRGRASPGVRVLTARTVVVSSDAGRIPVGVDGESVWLPSPVRCTIRPGALRVRVPRDRPGVPPPAAAISLSRLLRLSRLGGLSGLGNLAWWRGGAPGAGRLPAAHRAARRAGAGPPAVAANPHLRRGAAGRLVGQRPAGAGRGHRRPARPAGPGPRGAGGDVRDQLGPPPVGRPPRPRRPGELPCLGRQAAADGAVPGAAPARGGDRRPGADRRPARLPARVHLLALGPAAGRGADRAAADAPAGAAGQAAVLPEG
jgi:diacylglycerol kinase family enzyme